MGHLELQEDQQLPFVKSFPPETFHPSLPQNVPGAVPSRTLGEYELTLKSPAPMQGNSQVWDSVYDPGKWRLSEKYQFALSMSY